jgi:hypothetical protein
MQPTCTHEVAIPSGCKPEELDPDIYGKRYICDYHLL